MTRVVVEAGSCGFIVMIEVFRFSTQRIKVTVASDCEMVSKWGKQLGNLYWQDVLKFPKNFLFSAFQYINHVACPVPVAVLKTIEAEVGIASPKNVTFRFETVKSK